jgi:hypothetical protein
MDRSEASALADLQMHWDEAYIIGLNGDIWTARYCTSTDELRAHTSTELRELIRSDYTYRQQVDLAPDDPHGDDEDEVDTAGQDGEQYDAGDEADAEQGAESAAPHHAERVDFGAIRGERMST